VLGGLLRGLAECTHLSIVAPKLVVVGVLLLDELVVMDVGGEEGRGLRWIGVFGEVSECASELILAVFSRNVSTVARDLCPRIALTHIYNFQSTSIHSATIYTLL